MIWINKGRFHPSADNHIRHPKPQDTQSLAPAIFCHCDKVSINIAADTILVPTHIDWYLR